MPSNRDDFSIGTIRTLAQRVSYRCSCPGCPVPTVGPSRSNSEKSILLGKAAHITAAAPGGPRYDPALTADERRSAQNGIWLCSHHAELIDKDVPAHPMSLLEDWKEKAEKQAEDAAFGNLGTKTIVLELSEEDRDFLRSFALQQDESVDAVWPRLVEAARTDIRAFMGTPKWPVHAIQLGLTLQGEDGEVATTLAGLGQGVFTSGSITLVSPPGTGKSTTLIQLAAAVLEEGKRLAAYIPLNEWKPGVDWFKMLLERNAFRSFKPQHFMQLAYEGRLVMLFDGWNELAADASISAHTRVEALLRDYPQLGIVIGTRQQALSVQGTLVRLEPLDQEQQLELARAIRGRDGEALVEQAWTIPGVRDLVTIPLYLDALMCCVSGAVLPDTKDAVLDNFVRQHESDQAKAVLFRTELQGVHRKLLTDLANTATSMRTTTLVDEQARASIGRSVTQLQGNHQLTVPLQPGTVLDKLVDTHLLTRTSAGDSVSFQHQQFQEWFASFHVERLMLAAVNDAGGRNHLRNDILNWPSWEESVLFACERLSRKGGGVAAVAQAIIDTLGIDPMLAAEMIYRSSSDVWVIVRDQVIAFADRWHTVGEVDRAVRFMALTGKSDFADRIWPLLESSGDQAYLVLRSTNPFRLSVLGPSAKERLTALPDAQRGSIVAEIAHQGGYDGIELATSIAKAEPNPAVVVEILAALDFRRATGHIADVLTTAENAVWQEFAKQGHFSDLADDAQRTRLAEIEQALVENENDPLKQARLLLRLGIDGTDAEKSLHEVLISEAVLAEPDKGRSLFAEVHRRYPDVAAAALVRRLESGVEVPSGSDEILDSAAVVDTGPITEAALKPESPKAISRATVRLIGPNTVGKLIDTYVTFGAKLLQAQQEGRSVSRADADQYFGYRDVIGDSRQTSFLPAVIERAGTKDVHAIRSLAELLHLHGRASHREPLVLAEGDRTRLIAIILGWSDILLAAPNATRHDLAELLGAMSRLPTPEFVPVIERMLDRELAGIAQERKEWEERRRMSISVSHRMQYRFALVAIGGDTATELAQKYLGDVEFGAEAAYALLDIWNHNQPKEEERGLSPWHDYSKVKARREQLTTAPPTSGDSAEAIFSVVRALGAVGKTAKEQLHAVTLASVAMQMPFGVNRPELEGLLALPLPYEAKKRLFVVAAMSGRVLSADKLIEAVREYLHDAKTKMWMLDHQHQSGLMTWIELFALSDRPLTVLEAIDLLPTHVRGSHAFGQLLRALGHSPHTDTVKVLTALAQRDGQIKDDDDWLAALIQLNTVEAARTALEALCEGIQKAGSRSRHQWSYQLAIFARSHSTFKADLLACYADVNRCKAHNALEGALLEIAEPDTVLAVIRQMASRGQKYDDLLSKAIESLAVGQKPSARWINSVERFSVQLTEFRKQLFGMLEDKTLAPLARQALEEIEELRDEYGRLTDEPRHPDIVSGKPWPIVPDTTK